jgi:Ribose/xylose/arabinose/galactoside ABC-type transport systems, permease components
MATKSGRTILSVEEKSWKTVLLKWESILFFLFIIVNIINASISPLYLSVNGLFTATSSFLEKAFLVLPMVYVLIMGEIDISVGSTVALSAVLMAMSFNAGVPMGLAIVICLLVGAVCGFINGLILTKFQELAPMIVTLGTMTLYRGIAEILLEDQPAGGLTAVEWFSNLYWGSIGGVVPYMFVVFVIFAVVFGLVLHKTIFGRCLYAIGSNRVAAKYSGIAVQRNRLIVYTLTGLLAGVTAVFLAARMGSTRSNIAEGYELEAISMVVLGGVSSAGGKGNFLGAMISIFIVGFLRYGLGLINVPVQWITLIIGSLLIIAVLLPNLKIGNLISKIKNKNK